MEVDLLDLSYDGTTTEGLLYGGLGQLHDGITGDHNFRTDIGHGKGKEGEEGGGGGRGGKGDGGQDKKDWGRRGWEGVAEEGRKVGRRGRVVRR